MADLRKKWLQATSPIDVIVNDNLKDAFVCSGSSVFNRITYVGDEMTWKWSFEVTTRDAKYLTNVCLADEYNRDYFCIKSVVGENTLFTQLNNQHFAAPANVDTNADTTNVTNSYQAEIEFKANSPGTYSQDLIFGFNQGKAIRRQLCLDCVLPEDINRLEAALEYLMYLNQNVNTKKTELVQFHTTILSNKDDFEEAIIKSYPIPELPLFVLTHTTLREDGLEPRTYRRRLHELVSIEEMSRREHIGRFNAVAELRVSSTYTLGSDTDGSTVTKYAQNGELFAQLPLGRQLSEDTKSGRLLLQSCKYITIQTVEIDKVNKTRPVLGDKIYEAQVEDKCNHSIYVRLSSDCVKELKLVPETNIEVYVQFMINRMSFCEWHRAIDALPSMDLVFPNPRLLKEDGTEDVERFQWKDEWMTKLPQEECKLNERQREAVAAIMEPVSRKLPPVLILGPFGTGKTSTIAQALRILLLNDQNSRVLLCTQSNSAADLYVKDFFHGWYTRTKDSRLKPLRIYYSGRSITTVHVIVRDYCLTQDPKTGKHFRYPSNEDLESHRLVIATLSTSAYLTRLDFHPTHIIIDEAAQALECEAIMSLGMANESTRIVLAGDQMQLAPEVYSDLAMERHLGMSLLERIHLTYEPNHPCRIQLCRNYRAHADIVKLTSDLFYEGKIEAGSVLPKHPTLQPLIFYACDGVVGQGTNSTGFYNEIEAHEVTERVHDLVKTWPVNEWGPFNENSIGVLAHYSEQVVRIRAELRRRKLNRVNVERVLNVQGKQFTAVFLSIVRTRHCSKHSADKKITDYGLLTNDRLLNTAITRAKCLVAVIGDPVGLITIGSCKHLWRRYLTTASVYNMDRCELDFHLNKEPEEDQEKSLNPLAKEFVPREIQQDNPFWIEYVPMPTNYPVIHCTVD